MFCKHFGAENTPKNWTEPPLCMSVYTSRLKIVIIGKKLFRVRLCLRLETLGLKCNLALFSALKITWITANPFWGVTGVFFHRKLWFRYFHSNLTNVDSLKKCLSSYRALTRWQMHDVPVYGTIYPEKSYSVSQTKQGSSSTKHSWNSSVIIIRGWLRRIRKKILKPRKKLPSHPFTSREYH